jgi:Carboxypeptidase regulatory-like domain
MRVRFSRPVILLLAAAAIAAVTLLGPPSRTPQPEAAPVERSPVRERHGAPDDGDSPREGMQRKPVPPVPEGVPCVGRVTDARDGSPIEGALVVARHDSRFCARSDAEGRFEVRGVVHASPRLLASAPGYVPLLICCERTEDGRFTGDVALSPPSSIRGRVLDVDGKGVRGARVFVTYTDRDGPPIEGWDDAWSEPVTTRDDGSFLIDGLPADRFWLDVTAEGYARSLSAGPVLFTASEERERLERHAWRGASGRFFGSVTLRCGAPGTEVSGVDVLLERTGSLRVKIACEGDVAPHVVLSISRDGQGNREFAGLGGAVEDEFEQQRSRGLRDFSDIPEGVYRVRAKRAGWAPLRIPDVRVEAGKTTRVRLTLPGGVEISGKVTDPSGRPLADGRVHVWLRSEDDRDPREVSDLGLDESGGFRFVDLDPEAVYVVAAEAEDPGYAMSTPVVVSGASTDLVLRLSRPGAVHGRVVMEETGEPVRDFEIRVRSLGKPPCHAELCVGTLVEARDGDGTYRFEGLPPGRYRLDVSCQYQDLPTSSLPIVEIREGETTGPVDVRVERGAELQGVLRIDGRESRLSVGVSLVSTEDTEVQRFGWNYASGAYRVAGIGPGTHYLLVGNVQAQWLLHWRRIGLTKNEKRRLDLSLSRGCGLSVQVLSENGDRVPGARVTIKDPEGRIVPTGAGVPEETVKGWQDLLRRGRSPGTVQGIWCPLCHAASLTDGSGLLHRGCLPPGVLTIEIEAEGHVPHEFVMEIEADHHESRQIILTRAK